MSKPIPIIDLFSGPGGLGEGFSACLDEKNEVVFSIKVSIEMEKSASQTLTLRSFLRKLEKELPEEYVAFSKGSTASLPNWEETKYKDQWAAAKEEVRQLELGTEESRRHLNVLAKRHDLRDGVVIGGPPCQAYSLVGRARNKGKADYVPSEDRRHYLYAEYVRTLAAFEPKAFVMENVKGMLTASPDGQAIFHQIISDLKRPDPFKGHLHYDLYSLTTGEKNPEDPYAYVVRAERHGLPQSRHRVIILGIRSDVSRSEMFPLRPLRAADFVSVGFALAGLQPLKGRLSKNDSGEGQLEAMHRALSFVAKGSDVRGVMEEALDRRKTDDFLINENWRQPSHDNEKALKEWIAPHRDFGTFNHDLRGHMAEDLGRYLFVSAFGMAHDRSPTASEFPRGLAPKHKNWDTGIFNDRFRVQLRSKPSTTVTSHIAKDGHAFIHHDPAQCRSLTVREAARLQTFPDDYLFLGNRTQQYVQVGNAVPPYLAKQIAEIVAEILRPAPKQDVPER